MSQKEKERNFMSILIYFEAVLRSELKKRKLPAKLKKQKGSFLMVMVIKLSCNVFIMLWNPSPDAMWKWTKDIKIEIKNSSIYLAHISALYLYPLFKIFLFHNFLVSLSLLSAWVHFCLCQFWDIKIVV